MVLSLVPYELISLCIVYTKNIKKDTITIFCQCFSFCFVQYFLILAVKNHPSMLVSVRFSLSS